MGCIQGDVPEHLVGWRRLCHFVWVDLVGNKSILNSCCCGLKSDSYIMCFQSCASRVIGRAVQAAYLFSPHQRCDPAEVASYSCPHWLPVCLEGCVCFVYWKKHIFTTDSTPEPIKLRWRELFSLLLHAPLPVEWPAKASVSCWPLSLSQEGLASHTEPRSGTLPLGFIYCCFQQTLK